MMSALLSDYINPDSVICNPALLKIIVFDELSL